MADSRYLNEERYQKNKKMLMRVAIAIITVGVLVGGGLIIGGIIRKNNAQQIDGSMPTYSSRDSFDDRVSGSHNWMNDVSKKSDEEFAASGMIGGGGFIIFASFAISLPFFILSKQREIMAFQAQTVAPVAKEGIEKATPVVGKAVGSVAKEVAKGIKEGIKGPSEEEQPEKNDKE